MNTWVPTGTLEFGHILLLKLFTTSMMSAQYKMIYSKFFPYFWHKVQRGSLQRLNLYLILDRGRFSFLLWWSSRQIRFKISNDLMISRDVFFAHFGRFIRFVLRCGHPGGDPGLRYGLRSLRSLHSLRKVSSKSKKNQESQGFFVRFSGFKNQIPQSQL